MSRGPQLPIDALLPEIVDALKSNPNLVLLAPTGAGKTTRVPGALLDAGFPGRVVMLEPRRLAARAAATRIAEERGTRLGEEVGYAVRFDQQYCHRTRILVVTDGLFLRSLQDDPFLDGVGAVLFDEFHERSLNLDLSLALARQIQREARPDLRLAAMSATLDPGPIAEFLGNAPTVQSEGRLFPVEVEYRGSPAGGGLPDVRSLAAGVASAVKEAFARTTGNLLAFLPGVGEIRRTAETLQDWAVREQTLVLELFGDMPLNRQAEVLQEDRVHNADFADNRSRGRRKVVLATNIAETSLTVPNITAVVDSGLARVMRFDAALGLDRLELSRISKASAEQRRGRAGRTSPGLCLRLWSEREHSAMADRLEPEIRRTDVAAAVLQLLAWGESDVRRFPWFEPPREAALVRAETLLQDLHATDANGAVTPLGKKMALFPTHPRLARLLASAQRFGCVWDVALAAALLSEPDPFSSSPRSTEHTRLESDLLERARALESFLQTGNPSTRFGEIDRAGAKRTAMVADRLTQLTEKVFGPTMPTTDVDSAFRRAVFEGYSDRTARRRAANERRAVAVGGRGVVLDPRSAVEESEFFVCVQLLGRGAEDIVVWASAVKVEWFPAHDLSVQQVVEFDEATGRVQARRQRRYRDLVLEEVELSHVEGELVAQVLAKAASRDPRTFLGLDRPEVASFLNRTAFLRQWMPEIGLPTFTDEELVVLLPGLCAGKKSLTELRSADVLGRLRAALTHQHRQILDREAPERLTVPSGNRVAIEYAVGRPPSLAVRLQEMFGLAETPKLAGGRVALLLHLLAPNGRPQQTTQDLKSFWNNTYPQVRKDLRARYPKHAWPEDPWTAPPQKSPKRKT